MPGFGRIGPKAKKTLAQCGICNKPPHIGKGKTGSAFDNMTAYRVSFDTIRIDPCDGCGHYTKIQMIGHGMDITCSNSNYEVCILYLQGNLAFSVFVFNLISGLIVDIFGHWGV